MDHRLQTMENRLETMENNFKAMQGKLDIIFQMMKKEAEKK